MSSRNSVGKYAIRSRIPAAVILVVSLVISVLAIIHQGVTTTEVDVDDGGIWVTNGSKRLVGHLNYDSRTLDAALRTQTTDFDIGQTADVVTLTDRTTHTLAPIDVAQVTVEAATSLPQGAVVHQGGQRLGVLDTAEGNLWTTQADMPSAISFTDEAAVATGLDSGVVVTAVDGTVFAASARNQLLTSVTIEGTLERVTETSLDNVDSAATLDVTAVGNQPVIYNHTAHSLRLPDGRAVSLTEYDIPKNLVLQEAGPKADTVALASDSALILVPLDGSTPQIIEANTTSTPGIAAPPVRHKSCTYAAWGQSGSYLRACDNTADSDSLQVDSLQNASEPRFRTNRTRIVLNDVRGGAVWLPEEKMVLMNDWDQIESELDKDEQLEDSPDLTEEIADPQRREQNTPPEAQDDTFGVRPGRTTTLPVLSNDSDADGDVLTARNISDPHFAQVVRTRGGRALQITGVPDHATGSTTFTYEASDGQAVDTATVTVNIHPWSVNSAPEQLRDASIKIGAQAQIEYNVITDWLDPDGDPIFLANAQASDGLDVQFREEGTLVIRDLGATPGPHAIALEVSDGRQTGYGTLTVNVQPAGNIAPIANADFVVARAGETLLIEPLANDTDPNGDPIALVAVSPAPPGSTLTPDLDLDTVTFGAQAPGSYQFTYTVTDGPATAVGMIRVDVVNADDQATPVAEDDLVVLPAGGSALSAPLNNDSDPAGGVLVVQRIVVPQDLGLEVSLVDRHLLRITAPSGLENAVSFQYWVSNGTHTASALVTVVPTSALDTTKPPELQPDHARVRVGDVASVNVLSNDRSPAGLALTIDPVLQYTPDPEVGTPFVTGNLVRLEAGTKAGTLHVSYVVRDSAGNMATALVTFQVVPLQETNAAPRPQALTAWAVAGESTKIPVPLNNIDPDGDSVSLVGIEQSPTKGTVTLGVDWLEYTPATDVTGTDVFTYIVEDRLGKQAVARVRVGIAAPGEYNASPIAVPDTVLARPERRLTVPVLANDIDTDGDPISLLPEVETNTPEIDARVNHASITMTTPAQAGTYLVSYTVSDGRGGLGTGTLTVNVAPDAELQPPVARDDIVSLADLPPEGGDVTVSVLANDTDPDGDAGALVVSTHTDDVNVVDNKLVIVPQAQRRLVVYTVTDPDGLSASALVSVAGIDRTNPTIDASKVPLKMRSGESMTIDIGEYVVVRQGRSPRILDATTVRRSVGIEPDISVSGDRSITFTATPEWSGKTSVSFAVSDGPRDDDSALSAVLTMPIEVTATENQPPSLRPTPISVAPGEEPATFDLSLMVTDPDGADPRDFTYALAGSPQGIDVTLNEHTLEVSAGVDHPKGPAGNVVISVDDGSGAVETQIPITVIASTRPLIQTSDAIVEAAQAGGTQRIDLTHYTMNPFPDVPVRIMDASVQLGEGTVDPQGSTLNITPSAAFRGEMTVVYRLMDATGDPARIVQGKVRLAVKDRPDAPTITDVTPTGPGTAVVTFRQGADNGSTITGYTLTATSSGATFECVTTTCTATGLENGNRHSFTVVAHNRMGTSDPSPASAPVLVDVQPGEPTGVVAIPGDTQMTVTWQAAETKGSAITKYVLFINGGSGGSRTVEVDGRTTTHVVSGLENGVPYEVSIQAHNRSEQPSAVSQPARTVPYGVPAGVSWIGVSATQGNGAQSTVTLNWDYLSSNGPALTTVHVTVAGQTRTYSSDVSTLPTSDSFTIDAGESVDATFVVTNGGGATSIPQTFQFQALGTPAALTGTPRLTPTGTHGQLRVAGVSLRPGNGYSASQLALQYSLDQATWLPLQSSTIQVNSDQLTTVYFRQASTAAGSNTASPAISATAQPTGPMGAVNVTLVPGERKVSASWTADPGADFAGIERIQVYVNGALFHTAQGPISATGSIDIPAQPGTPLTVKVTGTNRSGNTATSPEKSAYPYGTVTASARACTAQEQENPAMTCALLEVSSRDWHAVTELRCTVTAGPANGQTFIVAANKEKALPTPLIRLPYGDTALTTSLSCRPR